MGYLAVPCESVCASYVVRQSTRRLRRVRGGLNINGDAFVRAAAAAAAAVIPFRHTSGTGCGSRTGGSLSPLKGSGPEPHAGSIFTRGKLIESNERGTERALVEIITELSRFIALPHFLITHVSNLSMGCRSFPA